MLIILTRRILLLCWIFPRFARAGEERVPVVTLSAAEKAGYTPSLFVRAGLSALLPPRYWGCVLNDFKSIMDTFPRLAPGRGELSAKLPPRGWVWGYTGFRAVMEIFPGDYGYLFQCIHTQFKTQYVRRRAPLRPLASSPLNGASLVQRHISISCLYARVNWGIHQKCQNQRLAPLGESCRRRRLRGDGDGNTLFLEPPCRQSRNIKKPFLFPLQTGGSRLQTPHQCRTIRLRPQTSDL